MVTDFDGTLSAVVDDPAAARPLDGVPETLGQLASRFGRVGVVSGRPAAFLVDRLGLAAGPPAAMAVVGLYGLERVGPTGDVVVPPGVERWRAVVTRAADEAERVAPPGAAIERKGLSVTLHWRTRPEVEPWATRWATAAAARYGLELHRARMSCELRPPVPVDKGTAVAELVAGFRAACFLGDDLGDLPAFAALDRLAAAGAAVVKVAVRSPESPPELLESASMVVDGPAGALAVLRRLVDGAAPATG